MPDPKKLKVGDLVRFVSLPEEWKNPEYVVQEESIEFMKIMVSRKWPSRVHEVDEWGFPWIAARVKEKGRIVRHTWGILEKTGWRLVRRRV